MIGLFFAAGCFEEFEVHRDSLEAARPSIDAGWIPRWFPHSTRDIRERHDIDTNEIWVSFTYDPQDGAWIEDACNPVSSVLGPRSQPRWWPESLSGQVTGARQHLFVCNRTIPMGGSPRPLAGVLATDPETGEAWYWEPYREAD